MLAELDHVLKKTYVTRANVEQFLGAVLTAKELAGDDPCNYWRNANFLNIQGGGNSQREMLAMFETVLQRTSGLDLDGCRSDDGPYIYLDDVIFTGNRIKNDLSAWIQSSAPATARVHVVVIGLHLGGQWYAKKNIDEVANAAGKKVDITWWRGLEIEDRKRYVANSDVLRPSAIPADAAAQAYAQGLQYAPVLRPGNSVGREEVFFVRRGAESPRAGVPENRGVQSVPLCPNLNQYQRPLGNMVLQTLGFGALIVTFRNCANNCPLAFWVDSPWYPLSSPEDELMGTAVETRSYERQDSVVFCKTNEEFGGLSNMAPGFPLRVNGIDILTSEALYQACRFPHLPDVQRLIITQKSPHDREDEEQTVSLTVAGGLGRGPRSHHALVSPSEARVELEQSSETYSWPPVAARLSRNRGRTTSGGRRCVATACWLA